MPPPSPRSEGKAAAAPAGGLAGAVPVVTGPRSARPAAPLPTPLPMPLSRFNAAPTAQTSTLLLRCTGSRRWAIRVAACRPYPDMDALLAAADEASYDMTTGDLAEALAAESAPLPSPSPGPHAAAPSTDRRGVLAAHTALRAAYSAYEDCFGHAFVVCLDTYRPEERLDQALAAVRSRLGNDTDEERAVAAEELRLLARGRLSGLVTAPR